MPLYCDFCASDKRFFYQDVKFEYFFFLFPFLASCVLPTTIFFFKEQCGPNTHFLQKLSCFGTSNTIALVLFSFIAQFFYLTFLLFDRNPFENQD